MWCFVFGNRQDIRHFNSFDISSSFLKGLVLAGTTAQLLPRNAAEALLRSNEFDVQAAATAFRASPREALDLAGFLGTKNHFRGGQRKTEWKTMKTPI